MYKTKNTISKSKRKRFNTLFLLLLIPAIQTVSFKYPTAIVLKNDNIFVVHSQGIDICDSLLQTNQRKLTFDNEITEEDLSKITLSKYSDDKFLLLIINYLYVFDENGNQLASKEVLINGEYYTLSAYKITSGPKYYFLLGYIDQTEYNLKLYYSYMITDGTIKNSGIKNKYTDNIVYSGLSCQFVLYYSYEYIMCIYQKSSNGYPPSNSFVISFFEFSESEVTFYRKKIFSLENVEYIQSTIKSIDTKPFFCGVKLDGGSFCLIYDFNDYNRGNGDGTNFWDEDNIEKCKSKPFNIKTYYFQETGEYVFSCLTVDNGIQTTIYDKDMTQITDIKNPSKRLQEYFPGCDDFYYSVLYSKTSQKYYIISDNNCETEKTSYPLIEEEEEYKTKEIEINIEENFENYEEEATNEKENDLERGKGDEIEKEEKKNEEREEKEIELNLGDEEEKNLENKLELNEEEENLEKIENISENENNNCILEKCSQCNDESINLNLCKKCNIRKKYYPINRDLGFQRNQYIDCYNKTTKPKGFYLDKEAKEYKLCYLYCKTCDFGGDGNENNCTSCKNNLILKPDIPNSSNCVAQCIYFYYYQNNRYKCTDIEKCPDNYQLEVKEKRKCIDKCEYDDLYIYQYDAECYKEIPEGTRYDTTDKICKDIDIENCILKEKILRLKSNNNMTEHEIKLKAKLYAEEFDYTNEHVTVYKNDFYSITIYKDGECSAKLGLTIDEIDFGKCYKDIKDEFNINGNLIIVIIAKIINGISYTIDKFIFNPNSGEKINFIEICINETLKVKRSLKEQMKYFENIELMEELIKQGIDIFNTQSDFYTDLCFHFKSPIDGKNIPLKDRLKLFFPNVTLCDPGCNIKGVNITIMKAMCECSLNKLISPDIFGNNLFVQQSLGELQDIITKTNIVVVKCYKDLFNFEMYKNNTGMIITTVMLFIQILFILIYFCKFKNKIKIYTLGITDIFLSSLYMNKNHNSFKCSPPKNNSSNNEIKSEHGDEPKIKRKINNKSKTYIRKKENQNKVFKNINHKLSMNNLVDSRKNIKDTNININEKAKNLTKEIEPILPNFSKYKIKINIDEYIKTDPDDMDYDDAIRKDKRTFCRYFYDKIKSEQIILSTFLNNEILKPIPIKITLLILDIDLYLIINGLFFNENYISDLLDTKTENVMSFINRLMDRIVIITITGVIINHIIEFFFTEESKIKRLFKREKENTIILKYEIIQLIKNIFIRYTIFIVISLIIMLFSIYYAFCFNNVYTYIKGEWLKSSLIIIAVMQILPIFLCFLDATIRFISFKCRSERLFRLSSIIL